MGKLRVALSATTQPWRAELGEYLRDHVAGMTATTVRDQRELRGEQRPGGRRRYDVVVLDDVMRIFTPGEVGAAKDRGTRFIGLFSPSVGRGQPYLVDLDVDQILPATTPIADLVAAIRELSPPDLDAEDEYSPPFPPPTVGARPPARRCGAVTVISRACGGVGSTETSIALTDQFARFGKALMVEADELGPSAATRLGRDPDRGLGRALSLVAHGHRALPDGLSPPGRDARPLGTFDVICGSSLPGGPPAMNPQDLMALVEEAADVYDQVVVEINVLVAGSSEAGRDRFAAARAVLARADRVVVITRPDGEGAMRLVNCWLPAAATAGVTAPVWAVFGQVPRSRFRRAKIKETLADHLAPNTLAGVHYLPADPSVSKAKWNAELVRGGRWFAAQQRLAADLIRWPPTVAHPYTARAATAERAASTRTGARA